MRPLHWGEDAVVSSAFALMVLLPVSEVALRFFFRGGIPSSVSVVQHLVLVVGMLGGALAARENRLLSFAGAAQWIRGPVADVARVVSHGVGAAMSAGLCTDSLAMSAGS